MRPKAISTQKWVLLLTSLISGLLLISTWAVASPPGGSPDEPTHFITIYCTSEKYAESCTNAELANINLSPVKEISSCYLFQRDRGAGCEKSNIFEKLSFGSNENFTKYADNNYYRFLSFFTTDYYLLSLLLMRIINGTLYLLIIFLSIYLLPTQHRKLFVVATFVVSVPLALYLVTSINTSSWMIIGSIGLWASLYSLLYEFKKKNLALQKSLLRIFLFILSGVLLVSSRFDGTYFFMIIVFSISIIFIFKPINNYLGKYLNQSLIKFLIAVSILLIAIYIFFQMRYRAQVTFNESGFDFLDRLFENASRLPHLLLGPMGTWGLGWLDVWLTPITFIVLIFIFLGLVFISIKNLDFPHGLSAVILSLSVIALPMFILMFSGYRVGEWVQPRYLLPLYFPLLGVLLFSSVFKQLLNKYQWWVICIFLTLAHSAALFTNIERYIRGQNTYSYNLNVGLEWWWDQLPSPNLIWILGSLSFLILFMSLNELTKQEALKTR